MVVDAAAGRSVLSDVLEFHTVFFASADAGIVNDFAAGQVAALHEFDCQLAPLDSVGSEYDVHLVVARHRLSGEMLGGARITVPVNTTDRLPLEALLARLRLLGKAQRLHPVGRVPAELSSLWVDGRYRGCGLGSTLIREALNLAANANAIDVVSTVSSPHMMSKCENLGFTLDQRFGHAGRFEYPDPRYQSAVMHIDCSSFGGAECPHGQ